VTRAKTFGMFANDSRSLSEAMDLPEFAGKPGARPKYPFWKMEVGDCEEVSQFPTTVSAAACSYGKRHKMKFTVRSGDHGKSLVWRIA